MGAPSHKQDGLEIARGFAALLVFAIHLFTATADAAPRLRVLTPLFNWGTEAVMLFFVLSGVVIRLSEERRARTPAAFARDRAIRLLPLYVSAVAVSCAVAAWLGEPVRPEVAVGNLLFLQSLPGDIVPTISTNAPLWSLSYEVGFYALFAAVLARRRVLIAWSVAAVLCLISFRAAPPVVWWNHIRTVVAFSTLWLVGYAVGVIRHKVGVSRASALACVPLACVWARVHLLDTYYDPYRLIGFGVLVAPLLLSLVSDAPRPVRVPLLARVAAAGLVLPVFWATTTSLHTTVIVLSAFAAVAVLTPASVLERLTLPPRILRAGVYLGAVSYALYVMHYPIVRLVFAQGWPAPVAALVAIALSLGAAHWLERVAQPAVARRIRRGWSATPISAAAGA